MPDELENLVRQWGREGDVPPPRPPPGDDCLTFAQAEGITRGRLKPDPHVRAHCRDCPYCRRLLADFAEAIAEGPPPVSLAGDDEVPKRLRVFTAARAALAAAAVVVVGLGAFLFYGPARPGGSILTAAEMGSESEIKAGLVAKGPQRFASGQRIMLRVELARDGYVSVITLSPLGRLAAKAPSRYSSDLSVRFPRGTATLGAYTLGDNVGPETWFVVVAPKRVSDVRVRLRRLDRQYDALRDRQPLAEKLRGWPAEVEVITFEHVFAQGR